MQTKNTISRRSFIRTSLIGGVAVTAGCAAGDPVNSKEPVSTSPFRPFELEEMTISEIQQGMESGRYTARSITEMYLNRIEENDRQGPTLGSIIETNPEALAIADKLIAERRANGRQNLDY